MVSKLIPTLQATTLTSYGCGKLKKGKKLNTKDILSLGVASVVGVGLIQATANL